MLISDFILYLLLQQVHFWHINTAIELKLLLNAGDDDDDDDDEDEEEE